MVTSFLYQPAAFGSVVAAAEIVGRVVSIWTVTRLLAALTFPALSVIVGVVDEPDVLKVWLAGQVAARPEPPRSAQVKLTVTGVVLFQPAGVGAGDAAATMVGAILSICTVTTALRVLTFPALSTAVCAVDEPDALNT
jgi:hypothetical protein